MPKIDTRKELKHLYDASARSVALVDVPAFNYLMMDGRGDPNLSPDYARAVEALFSVAYKAKFMLKRGPEAIDYAVMPLEGLWWSDDWTTFATNDRQRWNWTMMILQPPCVSSQAIEAAIAEVQHKKSMPAVDKLRFEPFTEGMCAQILHIGPFTEEGPTIERVHAFIATCGTLVGKHHEIYLSDIRRADPRRWRTVIRQPFQLAHREPG